MSSPLGSAELVAAEQRRARLAHAQNPARPEQALCGFPLRKVWPVTKDSMLCAVCRDLAHSNFINR
jgi:hypothetical protein